LLESELFGHEKGAFTGAQKLRVGKFEDANGGTVFLDEIGDIPLHLQTKLLRVLQEKEVERVGGNKPIPVDARVIAATNKDLAGMTKSGQFREDLFYRINVFPIHLPPLKQRLEDIPLLAEHFIRKHTDLSGGRVTGVAPNIFAALAGYDWPGNVRELENVIKRALIKTEGTMVTAVELPQSSGTTMASPALSGETAFKDFIKAILQNAESKYLIEMLERHQGNVKLVAELMDLDRKTVYKKIEDYGINLAKYRGGDDGP
jgi:transcriptional regulator with PAS, ATPase and Fis domain